MSLDPSTNAMVGVGGAENCCIRSLPRNPDAVEAAALAYRAKVARMVRDSCEERYVIARICTALANHLDLGNRLVFLHQEWRFGNREKLDVLAIDSTIGQLVVIEAKKSKATALQERDAKGRTAAEQAQSYAAQLLNHASECAPFFQRLALALERIYGGEHQALRVDDGLPPRCELWWPDIVSPTT